MNDDLRQRYEDLLVDAVAQVMETGKAEVELGGQKISIDYRDRLNEHAPPQR